ncbi:MAG: Uridylate kinase PyrF [Candidatus Methanohalarchaeum thermophilum]|uniref:Uridylate kinase n=1 Tax=Methanohalarchaeum thermophilum TaxID=1903181 RepID=A0A1Q6DV72_METT1|nr:MAG: Uridylate kinase PyrF [Candidatus Methanohalarchaeum thermophilum]
MSLVINIGGSILAPDLDEKRFREFADTLIEISKKEQVFVVTGGGSAARDYIKVARDLGANEAVCDKIGIDVTRLNARLLISALDNKAYSEPPESYKDAENAMALNKIVVMGGIVPGQSTDAVTTILAEYIQADLIIFATSVDGVYTSDPSINEEAEKLENISPKELVDISMKIENKAGANAVVDPLASKILERSKIPAIVLNGKDPEKIKKAALENDHNGTLIK